MCPSISAPVDSTQTGVHKVPWNVVGRLSSAIRPTVDVRSHYIAEAGARIDVEYNLVNSIHVFGIGIGSIAFFLSVLLQSWLLFRNGLLSRRNCDVTWGLTFLGGRKSCSLIHPVTCTVRLSLSRLAYKVLFSG